LKSHGGNQQLFNNTSVFNMFNKYGIQTSKKMSDANQRNALLARAMAFSAGLILGGASIFLVFSPVIDTYSVQQKNIASFLAGMFGFTSIEALRRSFK
jgi:membrane-associated HD superfamily phosphohydrolase